MMRIILNIETHDKSRYFLSIKHLLKSPLSNFCIYKRRSYSIIKYSSRNIICKKRIYYIIFDKHIFSLKTILIIRINAGIIFNNIRGRIQLYIPISCNIIRNNTIKSIHIHIYRHKRILTCKKFSYCRRIIYIQS